MGPTESPKKDSSQSTAAWTSTCSNKTLKRQKSVRFNAEEFSELKRKRVRSSTSRKLLPADMRVC